MTEAPIQVVVAAYSDPNRAGELMEEIKRGEKAHLVGIIDAAVVVKDEDGKLHVTNAKARSRRRKGFVTGGIVGGVVGLLAGPVGWAALGGGAIGALAGRAASAPIRHTMEELGTSLTPNSSAIVAVVEHEWVAQVRAELEAEAARTVHETMMADVAAQLQAGGNVLYTAVVGESGEGIARVATDAAGATTSVSVAAVGDDGVFIGDAEFTDEEPDDKQPAAEKPAGEQPASG